MLKGLLHCIERSAMKKMLAISVLLLATVSLADQPPAPPASQSRLGAGYLQGSEMPDALALLKAPPAEGSKALARDKKAEAKALALHGTARWVQATRDADLFTPAATNAFSCAAGFVISKDTTPKIDALLRKTAPDFGMSTYPAKNKYMRPRPFVGNGKPTCTPEMIGVLSKDGSYPSGHAAIGYGWGMVLSDVLPKRKTKLLKRGKAFADSRRICNVHFQSDIEAGGVLATAVVDKLRANAAYQADVAAAKAELAALPPVKPDCAQENAALKLK
jgi:acid phosphatase (class A)